MTITSRTAPLNVHCGSDVSRKPTRPSSGPNCSATISIVTSAKAGAGAPGAAAAVGAELIGPGGRRQA